MKDKKVSAKYEKFKTVQIHADVKDQIVDYCGKNGLKIGGYLESLFLQAVSGSSFVSVGNWSGSASV